MPYSPTTWIEKATQVGPTNLNKLENGLAAAAAVADSASALGAAALPVTIYDAKGDLIVGTAADAAARLAVGSNGQVLTADSAQASGLRWRDRATYGTSPPASPQDGDEWIYPVDVANGVMWRFRYNASSGSAYKWESVGGASQFTTVQTSETTTVAGSWANLATVGPSLVIARAGDYEIDWVAVLSDTVVQGYVAANPGLGDFTTSPIGNTQFGPLQSIPAGVYWASISGHVRVAALTAGQEIRMKYLQGSAGTLTARERWLFIRPVRVS